MGTRGPIGKRDEHRTRRNEPTIPVIKAEGGDGADAPWDADEDWHPIATAFWESLEESGQSRFYEMSDWAQAYLLCESMSRELKPQFVGMRELPTRWGIDPNTGEKMPLETGGTAPVVGTIPIKGASLGAFRQMMAVLMVTEGDRRRSLMELTKAAEGASEENAGLAAVRSIQEAMMKKKGGQTG